MSAFCACGLAALLMTLLSANAQYNSPIRCLITATTVETLMQCWDDFVPPKNALSNDTWNYFQPTTLQRKYWRYLVEELLSSDGNCTKIRMSSVLDGVYGIKAFYDKKSLFCVLYEVSTLHKYYRRGWGLLMVPFYQSSVKTNLHISVSHPLSDGPVHVQAASVFTETGARSLLVSGLRKDSRLAKSPCRRKFFVSDGARDNASMFHLAAVAIKEWQMTKNGGCSLDNCAFVQFHGKANKICPNETVILSAGVGGKRKSGRLFYANNQLPVNRLKKALLQNMPQWNVVTPDDSRCKLTGVSNVFGQILNKVPANQVCKRKAKISEATGHFVHIEQAQEARKQNFVHVWVKALLDAFSIRKSN